MKCSDCQLSLGDFLDKNLSNSNVVAIEAHLKLCKQCLQELNELKKIKLTIKNFSAPPLSSNFDERLQQRIRKIEKTKPSTWRWRIAAMITAFAIMLSVFNNNRMSDYEQVELVKEMLDIGKPQLNNDEFIKNTQVSLILIDDCHNELYVGLCS